MLRCKASGYVVFMRVCTMNDEEIKEQLSLIGALAEDAEAGFESMLVPFSVYGIAIPSGTAATYCFLFFRFGKIRVAHLACRHRILPDFFAFVFPPKTRRKNTKSKRPHLCRSMGQHRLRHRIEFRTVVFRQNRFFRRVFYHRHIDRNRMRYERRHRTKESEDYNVRRRRFLAFVRPVLSLCRAVHGPAYHKRGNFRFARNSRPYRTHHHAEKEVCR